MVETDSVVASKSLSGSRSRRNDVSAVDGRIVEKGFVEERNGLAKYWKQQGLESEQYFWVSQLLAPLEVQRRVGCWPLLEVDHWKAWSGRKFQGCEGQKCWKCQLRERYWLGQGA